MRIVQSSVSRSYKGSTSTAKSVSKSRMRVDDDFLSTFIVSTRDDGMTGLRDDGTTMSGSLAILFFDSMWNGGRSLGKMFLVKSAGGSWSKDFHEGGGGSVYGIVQLAERSTEVLQSRFSATMVYFGEVTSSGTARL